MVEVQVQKAVVVTGDTKIVGPMPEPGFMMCVGSKCANDVRVLLEGFGEFTISKDYPMGHTFVYTPPYGWSEAV
tara:strand:- start:2810 stop:3031 length:222 start_codon:yes stop_codon:yes gene_type:complete